MTGQTSRKRDFGGLLKLAWMQPTTVGGFMNAWNADINANQSARKDAFGRINAGGLNVKDPVGRIPYVIGGGLLGRQAAKYLGGGPVAKFVGTTAGAYAGDWWYRRNNPNNDPMSMNLGNGTVLKGW